jgi:hypothetical protein
LKRSRKFQGGPPRAAAVLGLTICMVFLFTVLGGAGMAQNAVSAAQGQYGKKVTICHKGKKTISVGKSAVAAHLRHGDTVGTCASAKAKKLKAAKLKAAKAKAAKAKAAKAKAAKTKGPKSKAEKRKSEKAKGERKATPEAAKGKAETGKPDKGGSDKPNPGRGKGK